MSPPFLPPARAPRRSWARTRSARRPPMYPKTPGPAVRRPRRSRRERPRRADAAPPPWRRRETRRRRRSARRRARRLCRASTPRRTRNRPLTGGSPGAYPRARAPSARPWRRADRLSRARRGACWRRAAERAATFCFFVKRFLKRREASSAKGHPPPPRWNPRRRRRRAARRPRRCFRRRKRGRPGTAPRSRRQSRRRRRSVPRPETRDAPRPSRSCPRWLIFLVKNPRPPSRAAAAGSRGPPSRRPRRGPRRTEATRIRTRTPRAWSPRRTRDTRTRCASCARASPPPPRGSRSRHLDALDARGTHARRGRCATDPARQRARGV